MQLRLLDTDFWINLRIATKNEKMTRRIDPYSVRLFVTAARLGSMVKAAAEEGIAPSALSRRIADLEHTFETPLLVRSPKGIVLTEAGKLVFAKGEKIEDDIQSLIREVQDQSGEIRGTVRLYANMSSVIGFLPERLQQFMSAYPSVRVAIHEEDTRNVLRACLDDRADVGVGAEVALPAGIDSWHFASDPLLVILPSGHELARRKTVEFALALEYPLVGIHQGGAMDRSLNERAAALHKHFNPTVTVSSFDAVCRMVEAGLGIAIVPRSAASAYAGTNRFARRPLADNWPERILNVYALRKTPQPRAVAALIQALQG